MSLDEPQQNDIVEEINGIRVAFDTRVHSHLKQSALDFQKTPYGEGIVIVGGGDSAC
ncbi:hypothetical protein [Ammoniphilus oxalaticus]|uniref:hypothetical protein n=1 Tax=Ammoniphilus oxalaticus TaxID=66863 RepID=UPI00147385EF|nr:hypothetical protein [Ammoniphilus oxalaticus]